MNIILFGPPGAGKGTQAKHLVNRLNNYHISTGEILRKEISKKSEIGKEIINDMNEGKFISDDIVNQLIKHYIFDSKKKDKLVFDGYPRSLSQAKHLDVQLKITNQKIDFVFFLNVNKETIVKRIDKRKSIEQRSDDDLNTIIKRYDKYMDITRPVLEFYSKNPNFYEIDGTLEIDQITSKIEAFINV